MFYKQNVDGYGNLKEIPMLLWKTLACVFSLLLDVHICFYFSLFVSYNKHKKIRFSRLSYGFNCFESLECIFELWDEFSFCFIKLVWFNQRFCFLFVLLVRLKQKRCSVANFEAIFFVVSLVFSLPITFVHVLLYMFVYVYVQWIWSVDQQENKKATSMNADGGSCELWCELCKLMKLKL